MDLISVGLSPLAETAVVLFVESEGGMLHDRLNERKPCPKK
jgi:hypothetical protein